MQQKGCSPCGGSHAELEHASAESQCNASEHCHWLVKEGSELAKQAHAKYTLTFAARLAHLAANLMLSLSMPALQVSAMLLGIISVSCQLIDFTLQVALLHTPLHTNYRLPSNSMKADTMSRTPQMPPGNLDFNSISLTPAGQLGDTQASELIRFR